MPVFCLCLVKTLRCSFAVFSVRLAGPQEGDKYQPETQSAKLEIEGMKFERRTWWVGFNMGMDNGTQCVISGAIIRQAAAILRVPWRKWLVANVTQ